MVLRSNDILAALQSVHSGRDRTERRCNFPNAFRPAAWIADTKIRLVLTEAGIKALQDLLSDRIASKPRGAAHSRIES